LEDLAGMLDKGANAEVAADHLGDPTGTPEGVGLAVRLGPVARQAIELVDQLVGEPELGAKIRSEVQSLIRLLIELRPVANRRKTAAKEAGQAG